MENLFKEYPRERVVAYINYIEKLRGEKDKDGKKKNWWIAKVSQREFEDAFIKVANKSLWIDGDTVTLNYRKQLVITYDYHAYQNRIKVLYPETIFDFGLVYKGDEYTFKKESGKVIYNHSINDPFAKEREIIGAYGIIKNKKGEFIETIDMKDIEKMKQSSMMAFIWDKWFDRMVLKSVIKRICTVHFKDEVQDIEDEDNLQSNPDLVTDKELTSIQKDAIQKTKESNYDDANINGIIRRIYVSDDALITTKIIPAIIKNSIKIEEDEQEF